MLCCVCAAPAAFLCQCELLFPVINENDCVTGSEFDNFSGQVMFDGKRVLV